jgi:hypothetical protein
LLILGEEKKTVSALFFSFSLTSCTKKEIRKCF